MLFRLKDRTARLLAWISLITRLRQFFSTEHAQAWDVSRRVERRQFRLWANSVLASQGMQAPEDERRIQLRVQLACRARGR